MNRLILSGDIMIPLRDRLALLAPMAALTACVVGYRIGSVVIELLKRRKERKIKRRLAREQLRAQLQLFLDTSATPESDWEKVKRGETKNGFRLWRLYENESADGAGAWSWNYDGWCVTSRAIVEPPWPKYDNSEGFDKWSENETLTVLGLVNRRHPTRSLVNRRAPKKSLYDSALVLRRYSLLDPSIYADIARIVYESADSKYRRGWSFVRQEQLNACTVAIRFVNSGQAADRIVLIDTSNHSYRQFEIPPTDRNMVPLRMFLDEYNRDHFSVLYADAAWSGTKFVKIDYEIKKSPDPTFTTVRQLGMHSTPFNEQNAGVHSHLMPRLNLMHIPGLFYVLMKAPNGIGWTIKCFLFDHRGQRRNISQLVCPLSRRRIVQASYEFRKLVSIAAPGEAANHIHGYYFVNPYKSLNLIIYYGDLLGCISNEAIVQHRFRPPSMKRQAAEAIRRSVPKNDFPFVTEKNETGVDIFDGILDEKKKSVLIVRLHSREKSCSTMSLKTILVCGMAFVIWVIISEELILRMIKVEKFD